MNKTFVVSCDPGREERVSRILIIGPPQSGKTRCVVEWYKRSPDTTKILAHTPTDASSLRHTLNIRPWDGVTADPKKLLSMNRYHSLIIENIGLIMGYSQHKNIDVRLEHLIGRMYGPVIATATLSLPVDKGGLTIWGMDFAVMSPREFLLLEELKVFKRREHVPTECI